MNKDLITKLHFYIQPLGPSVPMYPKLYELYKHESWTHHNTYAKPDPLPKT